MPQGFPRDAKDIGGRIWQRKGRRRAQWWRMPTHTCTEADFFSGNGSRTSSSVRIGHGETTAGVVTAPGAKAVVDHLA